MFLHGEEKAHSKVAFGKALVFSACVLPMTTQIMSVAIAQPAAGQAPLTVASKQTTTQFAINTPTAAQSAIDKELTRLRKEELFKKRISLNATNATLEEIVEQVKVLLPEFKTIELRKANPVRLTFALENMPADAVLRSAATLAGSEVFVLRDSVVVAPPNQLTPSERAEWVELGASANSFANRGIDPVMAKKVATEVQRQAGDGVRFGNLSPESQRALLTMIAKLQRKTGPTPTVESIVSLILPKNGFGLTMDTPSPVPSSEPSHKYGFLFIGNK